MKRERYWELRCSSGAVTLSGSLCFCPLGSLWFYLVQSYLLPFFSVSFPPYPLLDMVSAFRERWPPAPHCGLDPTSWLLFMGPRSFHTYCGPPHSSSAHFRLVRETLIGLMCLATPGRVMDGGPAHRRAVVGSHTPFWSHSWKDGCMSHHWPPRWPRQQGPDQGWLFQKGCEHPRLFHWSRFLSFLFILICF